MNEMETETGKELDCLTMWDATHKKKNGSYINEEFRKKLEAAYDLQVSYTSSSANSE
ncbi:putative transposase, Ptta/En/Spm, plant [Dioscorea sansibarensis]